MMNTEATPMITTPLKHNYKSHILPMINNSKCNDSSTVRGPISNSNQLFDEHQLNNNLPQELSHSESQSPDQDNNHHCNNMNDNLTIKQLQEMSQAELINQVLRAQTKLQTLQSRTEDHPNNNNTLENEPNGNNTAYPSAEINSSNVETPTGPTLPSVPSELSLVQSPYVTTPPYEYIVLTKENETRFRIFLNSRLDRVFKTELAKLVKGSVVVESSQVVVEAGCGGSNDRFPHWSSGLPLPHASSSDTIIHCFDNSNVDLELKSLLIEKPPVTNKIVWRKPRKERGSSVPAIDSYYGTKDLDKVGHASYFIPELTPSERTAIGWKDDYRYGKWKYSTPNLSKSTTGQNRIPLIGSAFSLISKMKSSNHSQNSHHSHARMISSTGGGGVTYDDDINHNVLDDKISEVDDIQDEDLSFITLSDSKGAECRHVIRNKHVLKRIIRWLLPSCIKSKKSSSIISSDFSSVTSNNSNNFESTKQKKCQPGHGLLIASVSERGLPKDPHHSHQSKNHSHHHHHTHHHHHHGILYNCFPHRHKSEVTGGDVVASTDNSVTTISLSKSSTTQIKIEDDRQWGKVKEESLTEIIANKSPEEFPSFTKWQHSLSIPLEDWRTSSKIATDNLMRMSIESSSWISSTQTEYSTIASSTQVPSTSTIEISSNFTDNSYQHTIDDDGDNLGDNDDADFVGEDVGETELGENIPNFDETFDDEDDDGDGDNYYDSMDNVIESPYTNSNYYYDDKMPETRFLDPKDLLLPRYADLHPDYHLTVEPYYDIENEDYNNYNQLEEDEQDSLDQIITGANNSYYLLGDEEQQGEDDDDDDEFFNSLEKLKGVLKTRMASNKNLISIQIRNQKNSPPLVSFTKDHFELEPQPPTPSCSYTHNKNNN